MMWGCGVIGRESNSECGWEGQELIQTHDEFKGVLFLFQGQRVKGRFRLG